MGWGDKGTTFFGGGSKDIKISRGEGEGAGTPCLSPLYHPHAGSASYPGADLVTFHSNHFLNINLVSKLLELLEFKIT